jgi:hypothetical protein
MVRPIPMDGPMNTHTTDNPTRTTDARLADIRTRAHVDAATALYSSETFEQFADQLGADFDQPNAEGQEYLSIYRDAYHYEVFRLMFPDFKRERSCKLVRELEPWPAECEPGASVYLVYSQQSAEETGNIFKESRVDEAATAIATCILRQFSEDEGDIYNAMARTKSYENGLKNGETILALMRAASIVQIAMSKKLAGMHADLADDDDDEDDDLNAALEVLG